MTEMELAYVEAADEAGGMEAAEAALTAAAAAGDGAAPSLGVQRLQYAHYVLALTADLLHHLSIEHVEL